MAMTLEQQRALAMARARQRAAESAGPQGEAVSGNILPFSRDAEGNLSFDSNAGIVGAIKRAVTLPGDVFTGKTDPMSDEGIGRAVELGAFASPLNSGIRAGDMAIPGVAKMLRRPDVPPPSAQALKDAAKSGYDQIRDMGVDYRSDAVRDLANGLRAELETDGIIAELAPKTFGVLSKLQSPPDGSIASLAGIEAARRTFRHAAKDFSNPTEQLAAKRVVDGLDRFVERGDPRTVVAGPATEAGRVAGMARGNYAAAKRSDRLNDLEDTATRRAEASNSGQNIDNTIRQRIASLLQDPKKRAGFNKTEIVALETLARGTFGRNRLRDAGNLLGGGGGLGALLTTGVGGATGAAVTGGAIGGGIGAVIPLATGIAAKQTANALTKRALSNADKMTRKRSPLYQDMRRAVPLEAISPQKRAALMRTLLLGQSPQADFPMGQPDNDGLLRALIRRGAIQ
jgi:hypothetical protein